MWKCSTLGGLEGTKISFPLTPAAMSSCFRASLPTSHLAIRPEARAALMNRVMSCGEELPFVERFASKQVPLLWQILECIATGGHASLTYHDMPTAFTAKALIFSARVRD